MARLSVKHANQQIVEYRDFTGGLNTSNASEMIQQNELTKSVNVEIDKSTGLLKTVAGTVTLFEQEGVGFTDFTYDKMGDVFVICAKEGQVYTWDRETLSAVGTLTGNVTPAFCPWEDGTLIASGGKMQYYHEGALETLEDSPEVCNGVFVKDGRVWTYYNDRLHTSAVGDETSWETDTEASDSAQWIDIGYKDGGEIVGVVALSSDILIIKSNGHVFHLAGQFPEWVVREVSREVSCKGFRSCVAIVNEAIILGDSLVQDVSTTDTYGDMRAREISTKVRNEIQHLPAAVKLRYMPTLNQIWFVDGDRRFLFFDLDHGGYYQREYSTNLVDACTVGDDVFLLKEDKIQRLDVDSVWDEGELLQWHWRGKTLVSNNEYLVKRGRVDITQFVDNYFDCRFWIGKALLKGTFPWQAQAVYHDYSPIYLNDRELYSTSPSPMFQNSDEVYNNGEYIYGNETELYSLNMFRTDERFIERMRGVKVESAGQGGQLLFNGLNFEIAEV